ncbi:MAG TPA: DUF1080 domain-containing protein [Bryobacteraceae bacterium]|nr:DUF1080 domain-containing protein [Bryobacteraceae bacterium]HPT25038.1 DUF1080 domain-containing protein [Bryobacteraceae bacterium]
MSIRRRNFMPLAAVAALHPTPAQTPPQTAGWTSLFDGSTLGGWTIVDGFESHYYVGEGAICVADHASFPAWLRSVRQYENFELEGEFFIKGWTDAAFYLHAPEHGQPSKSGFQIKVFHQVNNPPTPYSVGAVFPTVAPSKLNVKAGWNPFRILMDWPVLKVWINGEIVQDLNLDAQPELKDRLRIGYLGIAGASTPCRFRALRIRELPSKQTWTTLYESPADLDTNWQVSEGKPDFIPLGPVLRSAGLGHLATKQRFRDFQFQMYARTCAQHNAGVIFRSSGRGNPNAVSNEIQIHNVEEAHFPTGSLYHIKRATYPRIEDEKWFFFELDALGKSVKVRINGDLVMEYDQLDNLAEGCIELQAHRRGYWGEYKHIRVRAL